MSEDAAIEQAEADGLAKMTAALAELENDQHDEVSQELEESQEEPEEYIEQEEAEEEKPRGHIQSEEEWVAAGNDPADYLPADKYKRVGELRDGEDTRQQLSKKLVSMEYTLEQLMSKQVEMIEDAKAQTRENTIRELQAQQKEAIDLGDTDKALQIERDINKQRETPKDATPADPISNLTPVEREWFGSNSHWFGRDQSASLLMSNELDRLEAANVPIEQAIQEAEKKVRDHFPYHFPQESKPARRPASPVERGQRKPRAEKRTYRFSDLPEGQRGFAKKMAKLTGMSENDYVKQIIG